MYLNRNKDKIWADKIPKLGEEIPENANLNEYIKEGKYRCALVSIGQTVSNKPSGIAGAFVLDIDSIQDNIDYAIQRLYNFNYPDSYMRVTYDKGVTWSDWAKEFNTANSPLTYGTNGFQRLASGLIIQWGFLTADVSGGKIITRTIHYNITFPRATFGVVVNAANYAWGVTCGAEGANTETFILNAKSVNPVDGSPNNGFNWMAIGY